MMWFSRWPFRRSDEHREERLASLVEEYGERLRRGEKIDVQTFSEMHPDFARELRDLLLAVDSLTEYSEFVEQDDQKPTES